MCYVKDTVKSKWTVLIFQWNIGVFFLEMIYPCTLSLLFFMC